MHPKASSHGRLRVAILEARNFRRKIGTTGKNAKRKVDGSANVFSIANEFKTEMFYIYAKRTFH